MSVIRIDGRTLYPLEGETVLETLERADLSPEYQCRQGYCGHCRLKISKGEVRYREFPLAYCRPGEIIACCAQVKEDLLIDMAVEDLASQTTDILL